MHKHLLSLVLAVACAGCAHHRAASAHRIALAPASQIEFVPDPAATSATLDAALPQFSRGAPPILLRADRPANSMDEALPYVQRIARRPLVAMTQYKDWFWYATEVSHDANAPAGTFVSGYAVQKGGNLAWRF